MLFLTRFSFLLCFCAGIIWYSMKWLKRFGAHRWVFFPGLICSIFVCQQAILRLKGTLASSFAFYLFSWGSALLFGFWAMFIGIAFAGDVLRYAWKKRKPFNPHRRAFLHKAQGMIPLVGSVAFNTIGCHQAIQGPQVKIQILPHALLAGLRIVQISDLHIGSTIRQAYVEKVVQQVLAQKPDLIVVTGDLADGTPESLSAFCTPLYRLQAPLGCYFVTGNHEYYWDVKGWLDKIRSFGWKVLLNENVVLQHQGTSFLLSGITDISSGTFVPAHAFNIPQAAHTTVPGITYRILLSHRPTVYAEAAQAGFHLMLSGHTHAGQFFPFNLLVAMVHRYTAGLNRFQNLWVYVNAGTGYWGPINRFLVPSEITVFEFHP